MNCADCGEPIYTDVKHECGNRPHMIKFSLDLFRISETIQKIREWWWKYRNKWGSGGGPNMDSPGVTP